MRLDESLGEWTDFDGAEFRLAQVLGMLPPGEWTDLVLREGRKHVFWSSNPVGDRLAEILETLVRMKVLEKNDAGQFRWNASFEVRSTR